jgi:hypothetical protein
MTHWRRYDDFFPLQFNDLKFLPVTKSSSSSSDGIKWPGSKESPVVKNTNHGMGRALKQAENRGSNPQDKVK